MNESTLVGEAKKLGYYEDLKWIAWRVFSDKPIEQSVDIIASFILGYDQMWHDVGNQDPVKQCEQFAGYQPLYTDGEHEHLNSNLRAVDYLETFKGFMRILVKLNYLL